MEGWTKLAAVLQLGLQIHFGPMGVNIPPTLSNSPIVPNPIGQVDLQASPNDGCVYYEIQAHPDDTVEKVAKEVLGLEIAEFRDMNPQLKQGDDEVIPTGTELNAKHCTINTSPVENTPDSTTIPASPSPTSTESNSKPQEESSGESNWGLAAMGFMLLAGLVSIKLGRRDPGVIIEEDCHHHNHKKNMSHRMKIRLILIFNGVDSLIKIQIKQSCDK